MQPKILITKPSAGYALIDSGEGQKLERFGVFTLARPDPQALWQKAGAPEVWQKAQGTFSNAPENVGKIAKILKPEKSAWKFKVGTAQKWQIEIAGLKFWIKPSTFKHVGIFPEQSPNWDWIRATINAKKASNPKSVEKISVLNLFGYTGGATLAAAQAGAHVCHVDGSKTAISWAKENADISGLSTAPIRWILDDALAFVKREVKRGNKYDGIIMDPPAFGRGPSGEVWKIEENFLELVELCKKIMAPKPLFFLINGYASGYSAIAYGNVLQNFARGLDGAIEIGELSVEEDKTGRLLPAGIFGRWASAK